MGGITVTCPMETTEIWDWPNIFLGAVNKMTLNKKWSGPSQCGDCGGDVTRNNSVTTFIAGSWSISGNSHLGMTMFDVWPRGWSSPFHFPVLRVKLSARGWKFSSWLCLSEAILHFTCWTFVIVVTPTGRTMLYPSEWYWALMTG